MSEAFLEELWRREEAFMVSAKPEFRHGLRFVGVSSIAGQFYCEFKVENEFALGELPSKAKAQGTALHDELVPEVEIGKDAFSALVRRKEPSFAVLRLWGSVAGLRIIGTPDHVIWSEGRPVWLVELKTTKGDPGLLWDDQVVQTRIYGLLLDLMGFNCSSLRLALVRLRGSELSEDDKGPWILRVSKALTDGTTSELESEYAGRMKFHLLVHDRAAAVASIGAKRGYWRGEREPTSSTSVAKCRACEYSQVCTKSLAAK